MVNGHMAWDYTDTINELFSDALAGKSSYMGTIDNADAVGQHGSISCGDAILFSIKLKKNKKDPLQDRIVKARYQTFGCTSAIASSEALCHLVQQKKMTPLEALSVSSDDIVEFLGGIPDQKLHCSVMGAEVLRSTVLNWAKIRGVDISNHLPDHEQVEDGSPIVCECFNKTRKYIAYHVESENLRNIDEIIGHIKVGGACGSCIDKPGGLYDIWAELNGMGTLYQENDAKELEDLTGKIESALEKAIVPELQKFDTTLHIVEIKNNIVYCTISGDKSLTTTVEQLLQELVSNQIKLIDL